MFKSIRRFIPVIALLLFAVSTSYALYYRQLVQRVNISKQSFAAYTFQNASASNDSAGKPSGSITLVGPDAPPAPAPVKKFDFDPNGSAWIAFGNRKNADGSPKDTVSIEGKYESDGTTERLTDPKIAGMKINNKAVVVPDDK